MLHRAHAVLGWRDKSDRTPQGCCSLVSQQSVLSGDKTVSRASIGEVHLMVWWQLLGDHISLTLSSRVGKDYNISVAFYSLSFWWLRNKEAWATTTVEKWTQESDKVHCFLGSPWVWLCLSSILQSSSHEALQKEELCLGCLDSFGKGGTWRACPYVPGILREEQSWAHHTHLPLLTYVKPDTALKHASDRELKIFLEWIHHHAWCVQVAGKHPSLRTPEIQYGRVHTALAWDMCFPRAEEPHKIHSLFHSNVCLITQEDLEFDSALSRGHQEV